jgi:hypothetical protein
MRQFLPKWISTPRMLKPRKQRTRSGSLHCRISNKPELLSDVYLKALAAFRALMILSKSSQLSLRKGGKSVMRYEFIPLNQAMIGALQDCLLSARPR